MDTHPQVQPATRDHVGDVAPSKASKQSFRGYLASARQSVHKVVVSRRDQVYNAQKRFRQRETNYVKELESNMTNLQQSITSIMLEKQLLDRQNAEMMALLMQKSADDETTREWERYPMLEPSSQMTFHHGDALVMRKHSSDTSTERVAVNSMPSHITHQNESSNSHLHSFDKPPDHLSTTAKDSWTAIDFILALETPCRDHVTLPNHILNGADHTASDEDGPSNHAMTMTAAVYARTLRLPGQELPLVPGNSTTYGFVPHFEIERLLDFSRALQVDDQYITPVEIYVTLKGRAESSQHLSDMLNLLRGPMASAAECCGFGAVLPVEKFHELVHYAK